MKMIPNLINVKNMGKDELIMLHLTKFTLFPCSCLRHKQKV